VLNAEWLTRPISIQHSAIHSYFKAFFVTCTLLAIFATPVS
jgi:hypothetical protein